MRGDISLTTDDDSKELIGKFGVYFVDIGGGVNVDVTGREILDTRSSTRKFGAVAYDCRRWNYEQKVVKALDGECVELDMVVID